MIRRSIRPVDPNPQPNPTPKFGQLKVLIIEETGSARLPSAQIGIFTSVAIREYTDKACSKTGNNPDFRVYDKTSRSPVSRNGFRRPSRSRGRIFRGS